MLFVLLQRHVKYPNPLMMATFLDQDVFHNNLAFVQISGGTFDETLE